MQAKRSDLTGDIVIKRGWMERSIIGFILIATTGSLGTSAYTTQQVSASDADQNTRIGVLEEQNKTDARMNELVLDMGKLLQRLDERTVQMQKTLDRIERNP